MIDKWISEAILAFLRLFIDVEWENLRLTWWSGITLDDLCIRQDLFAPLGLPLELHEGRIRRLHISGDWSYSSGIRPRIEISGVKVLARIKFPHKGTPPNAFRIQQASAPSSSSRPSVAVLRSLLRRICIELSDVHVVFTDTMSCATSPTSFGFVINSISTENGKPATQAHGTTKAGPSLGSSGRSISVDFLGAFYVPSHGAICRPANSLAAARQGTMYTGMEYTFSQAVTSLEAANDWVEMETAGSETAPMALNASVIIQHIHCKMSHWQLVDMLHVTTVVDNATKRMQFLHLLPPELAAASGVHSKCHSRRAQVCAMWKYSVLAVRSQLRAHAIQSARAGRCARCLGRYRTYTAACAALLALKRTLLPSVNNTHSEPESPIFQQSTAQSILDWLIPEHSNHTCHPRRDTSNGQLGNPLACFGALATEGTDTLFTQDVWLPGISSLASIGQGDISAIAVLLRELIKSPECCSLQVDKPEVEPRALPSDFEDDAGVDSEDARCSHGKHGLDTDGGLIARCVFFTVLQHGSRSVNDVKGSAPDGLDDDHAEDDCSEKLGSRPGVIRRSSSSFSALVTWPSLEVPDTKLPGKAQAHATIGDIVHIAAVASKFISPADFDILHALSSLIASKLTASICEDPCTLLSATPTSLQRHVVHSSAHSPQASSSGLSIASTDLFHASVQLHLLKFTLTLVEEASPLPAQLKRHTYHRTSSTGSPEEAPYTSPRGVLNGFGDSFASAMSQDIDTPSASHNWESAEDVTRYSQADSVVDQDVYDTPKSTPQPQSKAESIVDGASENHPVSCCASSTLPMPVEKMTYALQPSEDGTPHFSQARSEFMTPGSVASVSSWTTADCGYSTSLSSTSQTQFGLTMLDDVAQVPQPEKRFSTSPKPERCILLDDSRHDTHAFCTSPRVTKPVLQIEAGGLSVSTSRSVDSSMTLQVESLQVWELVQTGYEQAASMEKKSNLSVEDDASSIQTCNLHFAKGCCVLYGVPDASSGYHGFPESFQGHHSPSLNQEIPLRVQEQLKCGAWGGSASGQSCDAHIKGLTKCHPAVPRRTYSAAALSSSQLSHTIIPQSHYRPWQSMASSKAMRYKATHRSASTSLLQQLVGPSNDPLLEEQPVITVLFGPSKPISVSLAPFMATLTLNLVNMLQNVVETLDQLLPPEDSQSPADVACSLVAAADNFDSAQTTPSVVVSMSALSCVLALDPEGAEQATDAPVEYLQMTISQWELQCGTCAPAPVIARLVDDVRFLQDRTDSKRIGVHPAYDRWTVCLLANGQGHLIRSPASALASALTSPLYISARKFDINLASCQDRGRQSYELYTRPCEFSMWHVFPSESHGHPIVTVSDTAINGSLPVSEFAPAFVKLSCRSVVGQIHEASMSRVQSVAVHMSKLMNHPVHGSGAHRMGVQTAVQAYIDISNTSVKIFPIPQNHKDACMTVAWTLLHMNVHTPAAQLLVRGMEVLDSCAGRDHEAVCTAHVELSELDVSVKNGGLGDIFSAADAFVPSRTCCASLGLAEIQLHLGDSSKMLESLTVGVHNLTLDAHPRTPTPSHAFQCITPASWVRTHELDRVVSVACGQGNPPLKDHINQHLDAGTTPSSQIRVAVRNSVHSSHGALTTVSVLINGVRLCGQYLSEVVKGWPSSDAKEEPSCGSESSDNVAVTIEATNTEVFVQAPQSSDSSPGGKGVQQCGMQISTGLHSNDTNPSPETPLLTLGLNRIYILFHPQLLTVSTGLSCDTLHCITEAERACEELRSCNSIFAAMLSGEEHPGSGSRQQAIQFDKGKKLGHLHAWSALSRKAKEADSLSGGVQSSIESSANQHIMRKQQIVVCDVCQVSVNVLAAEETSEFVDADLGVSQQSDANCLYMKGLSVAVVVPEHSPGRSPPCAVDVRCIDGVHAALGLLQAESIVQCFNTLHSSCETPLHHTSRTLNSTTVAPNLSLLTGSRYDGTESESEVLEEESSESLQKFQPFVSAARSFYQVLAHSLLLQRTTSPVRLSSS